MKNFPSFFLALALCFPIGSVSASSDSAWIYLNENDTHTYSARKGSFEETETRGGVPIVSMIVQTKEIKNNQIDFLQVYVTKQHCQKGVGSIVATDMNGDFVFEAPYVSKGESVGSFIADFLCMVYQHNQDKGLSI